MKVVYFSVDLHGHINPTLTLISELINRGDQVYYYSNINYKEKIETTGANFKNYNNAIEFGPSDAEGIDGFFLNADYILGKTEIMLSTFMNEIKTLKPDLIIHDAFCLWGREMAKELNIPGVSLFAHFPYISEMVEKNPEYFLNHVIKAKNLPTDKIAPILISNKILKKATSSLSAKYNIENLNVMNDVFGSKDGMNIVFSSKELQPYSETFDSSYYFAGYEPFSMREKVPFNFERVKNRPLVYIAVGTILEDLDSLFNKCIKALEGIDCQIILSTGRGFDLSKLNNIPDNFTVAEFVPQLEILKEASLFITHGGANSIYESLYYQVPMVVIPQVFDEFMGGYLVEKSETGINLKVPNPEISEIKVAIRSVLKETTYKDNCKRIKNSLTKTGGLKKCIEEIDSYVRRYSEQ